MTTLKTHLLKTRFGRLDLLREIGHGLKFDDLKGRSREFQLAETMVRVLDLEASIETKALADRPKDRYALLFLRQLKHERENPQDG